MPSRSERIETFHCARQASLHAWGRLYTGQARERDCIGLQVLGTSCSEADLRVICVIVRLHQRRRQRGGLAGQCAEAQKQLPQAYHVALAIQTLQQGRGPRRAHASSLLARNGLFGVVVGACRRYQSIFDGDTTMGCSAIERPGACSRRTAHRVTPGSFCILVVWCRFASITALNFSTRCRVDRSKLTAEPMVFFFTPRGHGPGPEDWLLYMVRRRYEHVRLHIPTALHPALDRCRRRPWRLLLLPTRSTARLAWHAVARPKRELLTNTVTRYMCQDCGRQESRGDKVSKAPPQAPAAGRRQV